MLCMLCVNCNPKKLFCIFRHLNYFQVSRVFGPTGSEHLFLLVRGVLRVISLTTGRQMVKQEEVTGRFTSMSYFII